MSLPAMRAAVSSSLDEAIAEARRQGVSVEAFSGALARAPARFLTSLSSMVCRFASFDLTRRLVGDRWYRFVRVKDERILVAEGEGFDMVIVAAERKAAAVAFENPRAIVPQKEPLQCRGMVAIRTGSS